MLHLLRQMVVVLIVLLAVCFIASAFSPQVAVHWNAFVDSASSMASTVIGLFEHLGMGVNKYIALIALFLSFLGGFAFIRSK